MISSTKHKIKQRSYVQLSERMQRIASAKAAHDLVCCRNATGLPDWRVRMTIDRMSEQLIFISDRSSMKIQSLHKLAVANRADTRVLDEPMLNLRGKLAGKVFCLHDH